jgi:hypothetical protein
MVKAVFPIEMKLRRRIKECGLRRSLCILDLLRRIDSGLFRMKGRSSCRSIFVFGLFSLTLVLVEAQTNRLVLPRETQIKFGTQRDDPFFRSYFEQIYSSFEFSDLPTHTVIITDVAFRIDEGEQVYTNLIGAEVVLQMNTFRGPLAEILERKSGREPPITTVLRRENILMSGSPGERMFNLRFHLEEPYLYDWTLGHLVLTINSHGVIGRIDAEWVDGVRGFNLYSNFPDRIFQQEMIATEFSYVIPPSISSVRRFGDVVQIEFVYSGSSASIALEGSATVDGPYTTVSNVEFSSLSSWKMIGLMPLSAGDRFFRIRQNTQ